MSRRKLPNLTQVETENNKGCEQADKSIAKLQKCIDEIEQLKIDKVSWESSQAEIAEVNLRERVCEIFGLHSQECKEINRLTIYCRPFVVRPSYEEHMRHFHNGIEATVEHIKVLITQLREKAKDTLHAEVRKAEIQEQATRRIFIVHGHDELTKQVVARYLEQLDLKPIILHEQPNVGRTIIQKFEDYSNVNYAVILLTPDDLGSSASEFSPELKPRPRQNVIFELGFFIGKLGRSRVCALYKGNIELPSDYQGVLYIPMDTGEWKIKLAREMKEAGIDIDLNQAV